MSEFVMGCNFAFLSHFQTLIREVEEKEVSSQQYERDASLGAVLSVAFTLIFHLLFKNIAGYVYELDDHGRHCFSISAATQKAGLDWAGTPRDIREFGKGAL